MFSSWQPIGYLESCFKYKNGTPRQSGICTASQAKLTILNSLYDNPEHSLDGLEKFSHVWLIFQFHKNKNDYKKAKVKPPRLNGQRVGVFASRSPYRANSVGLTLAKLEKISGSSIFVSGIDIIDGTPILDIKPYIPQYDQPFSTHINEVDSNEQDAKTYPSSDEEEDDNSFVSPVLKSDCVDDNNSPNISSTTEDKVISIHASKDSSSVNSNSESASFQIQPETISNCKDNSSSSTSNIASWINDPPIDKITVRFTCSAKKQASNFHNSEDQDLYHLNYLPNSEALLNAIEEILQADPRSSYRRKKCIDRLYYFIVDNAHITAWFDKNIAEILKIEPKKKKVPTATLR